MSQAAMDALELELRQLRGVAYVAFAEQPARIVIEMAVHNDADHEQLESETRRLATRHIEGPVDVELLPADQTTDVVSIGSRVQLRMALEPEGGDSGRIELYLSQGGRKYTVEADASDPTDVARQVLRALKQFGYPTPFVVESVHELGPELGAGSLVVLNHPVTGERRRGLANGATRAEAQARAVLNALNRYLQSGRRPD